MNFAAVVPESPKLDPQQFADVRLPRARATTLPPFAYTSEEFYRLEVERMFMTEWNLVGRADMVSKPGDYFTVDLVGVPMIIVRDKDQKVRAFANTCRHRGSEIARGSGNTRSFLCPYHGWAYDLNGTLRGANGMDQTEGFDKAKYSLTPIRLETWGGFLFVNIDGKAQDLLSYLGNFPEEMASYDCENLVTTKRWDYDMACNWKLFVENALENFHVPMVHLKSISDLHTDHGSIETKGNWACIREKHEGTRALLQEDQAKGFPNIKTLKGHPAEGTHFVGIYPSAVLAMTKDTLWWLEFYPQGPHRTRMVVGTSFPKETVARPDFEEKVQYYYKRWEKSTGEDVVISEIQHRGVNSPLAKPGRLSYLEPIVHDFANWILDRVLDGKRS